MDISLIVATHNNEKTIEKAIRSALDQDFQGGYEVVVAVDASTDKTFDVVSSLTKEDDRILAFETERSCAMASRIDAINRSKGDYIMFLDGDDWLYPNALSLMFKTITEADADVVNASQTYVYKKRNWKSRLSKKKVYDRNQAISAFLSDMSFRGFLSTKMFRRAVLSNVIYPFMDRNVVYDDALYIFLSLLDSKKVLSIKTPIRYYNKANEDSLTRVLTMRVIDNIYVRAYMRKIIEDRNEEEVRSIFRKHYIRAWSLLFVDILITKFPSKKEKRRIVKTAKKDLKHIFKGDPFETDNRSYSEALKK